MWLSKTPTRLTDLFFHVKAFNAAAKTQLLTKHVQTDSLFFGKQIPSHCEPNDPLILATVNVPSDPGSCENDSDKAHSHHDTDYCATYLADVAAPAAAAASDAATSDYLQQASSASSAGGLPEATLRLDEGEPLRDRDHVYYWESFVFEALGFVP